MTVPVSPRVELQYATSPVVQFNAGGLGYTVYDPLAQIREDVTNALGVTRFGSDNFSFKNISCLFHDDKHPSASLHREKGLYCHACAEWFTWKDLAGALGIPWIFQSVSVATVEELPVWVHGGLPSEIRNGLISSGLTDLARALDLYYHYGDVMEDRTEWVSIDEFTFRVNSVIQTFNQPFDFTPRTFRKVFEQLQGRGLPKKGEFLRGFFLSYFSLQLEEGKKVRKNSKRGRLEGRPSKKNGALWLPTDMFELRPLADALGVSLSDAGPLEINDYQTGPRYRAASTFQNVKDRPGKYARKQIAAPTGISYPTIKTYAKLAGIVITPQPPKLRLMVFQKQVKSNVFLQDERGIRHEYTQAGAMQSAAMGGGKLYRAEWQASDYQLEENAVGKAIVDNAIDEIILRKDRHEPTNRLRPVSRELVPGKPARMG
jgi:hypothetical protein